MPNSYIVIGILAVMGIILSLKWMKSVTSKCGQVEKIEEDESIKWAKKWNEQREEEDECNNKMLTVWCDNSCNICDYRSECPFTEVANE